MAKTPNGGTEIKIMLGDRVIASYDVSLLEPMAAENLARQIAKYADSQIPDLANRT